MPKSFGDDDDDYDDDDDDDDDDGDDDDDDYSWYVIKSDIKGSSLFQNKAYQT